MMMLCRQDVLAAVERQGGWDEAAMRKAELGLVRRKEAGWM